MKFKNKKTGEIVDFNGVMINSSLVSAQSRKRIYWSNWKYETPEDNGIILADIIEGSVDEKYNINTEFKFVEKTESPRTTELDFKGGIISGRGKWIDNGKNYSRNFSQGNRVYGVDGKSSTLSATGGGLGSHSGLYMIPAKIMTHKIQTIVSVRKHEVDIESLKVLLKEHKNGTYKQISDSLNVKKTKVEHWFRNDSSFAIPDADIWFKLKELLNIKTDEFDKPITEFIKKDNVYDMANRLYDVKGLSPTLTTSGANQPKIIDDDVIRKLTPKECERLQTLTDDYTKKGMMDGKVIDVSDGKRLHGIGNGWTVDVIAHIFRGT